MKKQLKGIILRWLFVFLLISIASLCVLIGIKPMVFTLAKSVAETIMLNSANQAVLNVLEEKKLSYNDISVVKRNSEDNITGIEIDVAAVNTLKSEISNEIADILSRKEFYDVAIPIGTILGSEYTIGLGPKIKFRMQLTETAFLDFENEFVEAGINQTLHKILISIDISANILMLGYTQGFSVSTSAIAAQTVIVGVVPDTFTNVVEHPNDDIADEIFNYADLE